MRRPRGYNHVEVMAQFMAADRLVDGQARYRLREHSRDNMPDWGMLPDHLSFCCCTAAPDAGGGGAMYLWIAMYTAM